MYRGLSDMSQLATTVAAAISCGSYGTAAIMLTVEGSLWVTAGNKIISLGPGARGSTIIPSIFASVIAHA